MATATNNTGIVYSLDATSITGGITINDATGAVTFTAGWKQPTTITARASGCNGPKEATHTVTVYSTLVGTTVSGNQILCYGSTAASLSTTTASGGSGSYDYVWQSSVDGSTWGNAGTGTSFSPGTLFETTYYRVRATSGTCGTVTSVNMVTVTVNNPFTEPNITEVPTAICYNSIPAELSSTAAAGGSGPYNYQWQYTASPATLSSSWSNVGTNALTYQHGALTETTTFRLIATDLGAVSCGAIFSNEIVVTVNGEVTAGTIGNDQIIEFNTAPTAISSLTPGTGAGIAYSWESSVDGGVIWSPISEQTGAGYAPGALTQTTWYRRINTSTENSVACTAVSAPVKISVPIKVNLTVMLEGATSGASMTTNLTGRIPLAQPYNTIPWLYAGTETVGSIPAGVVDWVLVELRQATEPALATSGTILGKRAAFLKSDGTVVDTDGTSPVSFANSILTIGKNLYMVIRHRNHLAVMSANTSAFNAGVYNYNFTTGLAQAFGGGKGFKQVGAKYVMVSGDIDNDGGIYVSDYNRWASGFGRTNGYNSADLDMDGNVFVSDYSKWATNFGSAISTGIKSSRLVPKYFSTIPK
jgi:hypothetical protein